MVFPSIFNENFDKICKIEQNQISRWHLHFSGKTQDQYGMRVNFTQRQRVWQGISAKYIKQISSHFGIFEQGRGVKTLIDKQSTKLILAGLGLHFTLFCCLNQYTCIVLFNYRRSDNEYSNQSDKDWHAIGQIQTSTTTCCLIGLEQVW